MDGGEDEKSALTPLSVENTNYMKYAKGGKYEDPIEYEAWSEVCTACESLSP